MNWKQYRDFFKENKIQENHFVLGIDIGNASSAISYFDPIRKQAELLDISGGYGKPSAPTALQYVEGGEWIFGEYAILNANGFDALITGFAGKLGSTEYIDIGAESALLAEVAAVYLQELIASCRSINPKAEIAGIVSTVPDFAGSAGKAALQAAFERAGYGPALIELAEEREALLCRYFQSAVRLPSHDERLILLDFGARGLRGGVYDINGNNIQCLLVQMEEHLGTDAVDAAVYNLFARHYCENQEISMAKIPFDAAEQLITFNYQHKDMLFQSETSPKPLKLYFNFVSPPFSRAVTGAEVSRLIAPFERGLGDFAAALTSGLPDARPVNTVICTGGGFEMPWAKRRISSLFPGARLVFYRNSKGVLAEGATYLAAKRLGLISDIDIKIQDRHKIPWDIGIAVKGSTAGRQRFHALVERDSGLWQKPKTAGVILLDGPPEIEIFTRSESGKTARVGNLAISGLPNRPAGTTKLAVKITPHTISEYTVNIKDIGFGELFPASDLDINYKLLINN